MNKSENKKNGIDTLRLPHWLRKNKEQTKEILEIKKMLRRKNLCTVCESAGCPNIVECFKKPTATFMILGSHCTRNCRYCGVLKGKPDKLDPHEPLNVAIAAKSLGLKHVVVTSVTRDDLPDGGAKHFAQTVKAIKELLPESTIEVLIPDFLGLKESLEIVLESGVQVLNHNVETVPEFYLEIKPEADFQRSLKLLKRVKEIDPDVIVKSGIMVGLGETEVQLNNVFNELNSVDCDALTIGQYLRPSISAYPVREYVKPEKFNIYKRNAEKAGIKWVFSGPLVRSSYNAESLMKKFKLSQY